MLIIHLCQILGETIKIVIEDYVQHLSGYLLKLKFDPELLFSSQFQYQNRIALEFNHLYHWHPLMPDSFHIDGDEIPYSQFLFNTSIIIHYGVEKVVEAFSRQQAGQVDIRKVFVCLVFVIFLMKRLIVINTGIVQKGEAAKMILLLGHVSD